MRRRECRAQAHIQHRAKFVHSRKIFKVKRLIRIDQSHCVNRACIADLLDLKLGGSSEGVERASDIVAIRIKDSVSNSQR